VTHEEKRAKELAESIVSSIHELTASVRLFRDKEESRVTETRASASEDHVPEAISVLRNITDRLDALVGQYNAHEQEANRFQGKSLLVQWLLFWATTAAFVAAAIYANIARLQKNAMNETLLEIRKQTGFARDSAQGAPKAANLAQDAIALSRDQFRKDQRPYIALAPPGRQQQPIGFQIMPNGAHAGPSKGFSRFPIMESRPLWNSPDLPR
jgi:hypothetical protein